MDQLIKCDNIEIPNIPFLWYKEKGIILPINKIIKEYDYYTIIQQNILENENIYICHHSYLYYNIKKNNIIPKKYGIKTKFSIKINKLNILNNETKLIELGIKENEFIQGDVKIHHQKFSPSSIFHFKILDENKINSFICESFCNEHKLKIKCMFVIIKDHNIDKILINIKHKI